MTKVRKLLIFSCCIMIAAFAALWVGCKNQIWLDAEEAPAPTPPPTITISSVKDLGDKLRVGITTEGIPDSTKEGDTKEKPPIYNTEEEITAENAPEKWISVSIYNDKEIFRFVQGYDTMPQQASYDLDVDLSPAAGVDRFYVYARASYGDIKEMIKSNIVDSGGTPIVNSKSEYNGEEQSITRVENKPYADFVGYYYVGEEDNPKITYKKLDEKSNVESDATEVKDIGKYRVYSELDLGTLYSDDFPEGEPEPTKRPLGYFEITPIDLSKKATVKLDKYETVYSGEKFEPKVEVSYIGTIYKDEAEVTGDIVLTEGTDYEVIYPDDMVSAEEKKITINFKGNYTGSVIKTFTINPKDVSEDKSLSVKLTKDSVVCTGEAWEPEVEAWLGETELEKGKDYEIILPTDMVTEGEKQITVKFKGNYSGEQTLTGQILSNGWGKLVIDGNYKYWVDEDGTTSARITKGKNIWLKETSDGSSAWYGIDNTNNVFTEGSRFWVKWLGREDDKEEWDKYYEQLDDEYKKKVEDDKLWIFLCGVTDTAGNEYETLTTPINLYIQLGSDWDKEDIQSVFISEAIDEPVESIDYVKNLKDFPTQTGEYAKLKLKHFSPYAVYDELTDEEKEMMEKLLNGDVSEDELNNMISEADLNEPTTPDNDDSLSNYESAEPSISYITGDQRGYVIIIAVSALIIAGVTLLFSLKNKKNK